MTLGHGPGRHPALRAVLGDGRHDDRSTAARHGGFPADICVTPPRARSAAHREAAAVPGIR
ncbi:hypothetical protein [Streptomyces sp. DH10]|uniref:hypothetical protein n=1 Tax=Streptomyces sp. DH10 TaxID=3040121 RepID=UPI002440FCBD|nr:hypothetical protein [Streptomyces sp. DH10]MDG9709940.1 hypothetical protein [Streptomyces sp. DH10]